MIWDLLKYKDNIAFVDDFGNSLRYSDLEHETEVLSRLIGKRKLVFCLCSNTIAAAMGYVAFVNYSIVPVMLNSHMENDLLQKLIEVYRPEYMWLPQNMVNRFQGQKVFEFKEYILLKTEFLTCTLHEDLALLLTTSGSTGSAKFVRQSYTNIISNTKSIVKYLNLNSEERPITTLPMNYTYGLSIINSHLAVGATILVTEKGLMQKEFWRFFKEQKATSFGGVPYTYEMLDKLRFTRMELPDLRTMTQAGGKLTPELHAKFAAYAEKSGKKFIVMYGQCEATARMGYLPADKAVEKCGSMGIAIPGGRFSLMDENGQEIHEPHVAGELVYEGENVTLGYAECAADLAKGDERDGVLETGDMAEFDADGYYYIVGRKKRFLKLYGNRVNLDEVDRLIKGHFPNVDAACSGVDDHMFIFVNDELKMQEIKEYVAHKTGINHAAFQIEYISEIPRNDSGKVVYRELENYYKDKI